MAIELCCIDAGTYLHLAPSKSIIDTMIRRLLVRNGKMKTLFLYKEERIEKRDFKNTHDVLTLVDRGIKRPIYNDKLISMVNVWVS